ncbi:MAG: helix-hairpin-helix domain-containing protein [Thermoflavifilum sp.]|nr:helix-hairpin-helix domain-containing protein [Thermoflavifilum sp.]
MHIHCSAIGLCMAMAISWPLLAQQSPDQTLQSVLEQAYDPETFAEGDEEAAAAWVDQLEAYTIHPLDLNQATAEQLAGFPFLNALQIQAFLNYRRLLGSLTSVYELQAIPGWDASTIQKLLPFVYVHEEGQMVSSATSAPKFQWLSRYQRVMPRAWGYVKTTGSRYVGSPDAWLNKWQWQQRRFQAGLVAEKDAGEPFFRSFNAKGFDHVGMYAAYKGNKTLQQLLVGDYEVNFGQGLINWQSYSLNHSAYALQIEKNNSSLRPHAGTAEYGYFRGLAVQLQERHWQQTVFVSCQAPGAYWDSVDGHRVITSWDETGYHRTLTENGHRGILQIFSAGTQIRYRFSSGYMALNHVYHHLSIPMQKRDAAYNRYAFSGNVLYNLSVDYAWSVHNQHLFGEIAWSHNQRVAILQGWMMQISKPISVGALFRYYPKDYHTLYANGFSAGGETANETGWYLASEMQWRRFQVYAYVDWYYFPAWRYQISGPMRGTEALCRIDWQIDANENMSHQLMVQMRYRRGAKDIETPDGKKPMPTACWQHILGWTGTASRWTFALRGYVNRFAQTDTLHAAGFAVYGEAGHQLNSHFHWDARLAWFQVPSYDTRIYAYERTVPYMFSMPFYYHRGWRAYLLLHYAVGRHLRLDVRWATTWYLDQQQIGSGLDRIDGSQKHQLIAQLIWRI